MPHRRRDAQGGLHTWVVRGGVGYWRECPVSDPHRLTRRQEEVLDLLTEGLGNKQIARRLGISDQTVKNHLRESYARLDMTGTSRVCAAAWWHEHAAEVRHGGAEGDRAMSKPAAVRDELIRLEGSQGYYLRRVCVLLSPDGLPTGARWPLLLAGPFPRHQIYDPVSGALRLDAAALLAAETSAKRLWLHGSVDKQTEIVATF